MDHIVQIKTCSFDTFRTCNFGHFNYSLSRQVVSGGRLTVKPSCVKRRTSLLPDKILSRQVSLYSELLGIVVRSSFKALGRTHKIIDHQAGFIEFELLS